MPYFLLLQMSRSFFQGMEGIQDKDVLKELGLQSKPGRTYECLGECSFLDFVLHGWKYSLPLDYLKKHNVLYLPLVQCVDFTCTNVVYKPILKCHYYELYTGDFMSHRSPYCIT